MVKTDAKQQEESVVVGDIAYAPTEDQFLLQSYIQDVSEWDSQDAHKAWLANNVVALKTGHNGIARYLVIRAPQEVVRLARCNEHVAHVEDEEKRARINEHTTIIESIFTIKLVAMRDSEFKTRKLYTIGYTLNADGSRSDYQLTGGLNFNAESNMYVCADLHAHERFDSIVSRAAESALDAGTLDSEMFSNELGREKRQTAKAAVQPVQFTNNAEKRTRLF